MLAKETCFSFVSKRDSILPETSRGEVLEKMISSCNEPYRTSEKFFRKPPHEINLSEKFLKRASHVMNGL
jgi:hypothetical protein